MEHLASYLKDFALSQAEFAARVGITQSALSKLLSGDNLPKLETAIMIDRETGGRVPANGWERVTPKQAAS